MAKGRSSAKKKAESRVSSPKDIPDVNLELIEGHVGELTDLKADIAAANGRYRQALKTAAEQTGLSTAAILGYMALAAKANGKRAELQRDIAIINRAMGSPLGETYDAFLEIPSADAPAKQADILTDADIDTAINAGRAAAKGGKAAMENPHPIGSALAIAWTEGHEKGVDETVREMARGEAAPVH